MNQMSFLAPIAKDQVDWAPTATTAKARLQQFLPKAGKRYAQERNFDLGKDDRRNVSALSPWIRHRLLLEQDVLRDVLAQHHPNDAEKFIAEVFWRGYFKGWLEHRPEVWRRYRQNVSELLGRLDKHAALSRRYDQAVAGQTGIDCFDAWSQELKDTGYLHNHARMWFASIWIFTLQLPWELGADFFYRHLLDGDPASNTCSWRWIGGLHTQGKTYLARADNIDRFTNGLFNPDGQLASDAPPLVEPPLPAPALPRHDDFTPSEIGRFGLIVTEEDCSPETLSLHRLPQLILVLSAPTARSVLPCSDAVKAFASGAVADAAKRIEKVHDCDITLTDDDDWRSVVSTWARAHDLDAIATPYLPIGPVARRLLRAVADIEIPLVQITRRYDAAVWPHAKRGFFGLKKKIPDILTELDLIS